MNTTDHQTRTEDQPQPETQVEHSGASDCSFCDTVVPETADDGRRKFVKDVSWDAEQCKLNVTYCDFSDQDTDETPQQREYRVLAESKTDAPVNTIIEKLSGTNLRETQTGCVRTQHILAVLAKVSPQAPHPVVSREYGLDPDLAALFGVHPRNVCRVDHKSLPALPRFLVVDLDSFRSLLVDCRDADALKTNADDHRTRTADPPPQNGKLSVPVHRIVRRLMRFDSLPPHLDRKKHWTETLSLTPPDKSSGNFHPKEGDVAYEIDVVTLLSVAKPTDKSIDECLERCLSNNSLVAESNAAVVGYFVVHDLSDGQQLIYMNGVDHPPVIIKTVRLKTGIN